jgi:tRNA threonylcarbamoyladenosine biosynthesis protein TsaE
LTHPGHLKALHLHLPDLAATGRLGAQLAGLLRPGLKIYLSGELGSGKTTLVRALLRAAGHAGRVKSPTYTLVELYVISKLYLYHFDFYRFRDPEEWQDAGFREHFDGNAICLVEWPEKAAGLLPPADLDVSIQINQSGRDITITANSASGENCLIALQPASSS